MTHSSSGRKALRDNYVKVPSAEDPNQTTPASGVVKTPYESVPSATKKIEKNYEQFQQTQQEIAAREAQTRASAAKAKKIEEAQRAVKAAQRQVDTATRSGDARKRARESQKKYAALERKLEETALQKKMQDREIEVLQGKLEELKIELASASDANNVNIKSASEIQGILTSSLETSETARKELKEQNAKNTEELIALQRQLQERDEKIGSVEKKLDSLQTELKEEKEKHSQQESKLQEAKEQFQQTLTSLRDQLSRIQTESSTQSAELVSLRTNLEKTQTERDAVQEQLQQQLQQQKAEHQRQLSEQAQTMRAEMAVNYSDALKAQEKKFDSEKKALQDAAGEAKTRADAQTVIATQAAHQAAVDQKTIQQMKQQIDHLNIQLATLTPTPPSKHAQLNKLDIDGLFKQLLINNDYISVRQYRKSDGIAVTENLSATSDLRDLKEMNYTLQKKLSSSASSGTEIAKWTQRNTNPPSSQLMTLSKPHNDVDLTVLAAYQVLTLLKSSPPGSGVSLHSYDTSSQDATDYIKKVRLVCNAIGVECYTSPGHRDDLSGLLPSERSAFETQWRGLFPNLLADGDAPASPHPHHH